MVCWHFDNDVSSKFDDVLIDYGGLPYVLPLAVHLTPGTPPSYLKVRWWVACRILVSAQVPLVFGLGLWIWGLGLTILFKFSPPW